MGKYRFKKRNNWQNENNNEEQEQANGVVLFPCAATSAVPIINTITSPSMSISDTPSVASKSPNISRLSTPTRNLKSLKSLEDQLILMAQQLSKIYDAIENIHIERTTKELSPLVTQAYDLEQMFECMECLHDFFVLRDFEINDYLHTITPIPCST